MKARLTAKALETAEVTRWKPFAPDEGWSWGFSAADSRAPGSFDVARYAFPWLFTFHVDSRRKKLALGLGGGRADPRRQARDGRDARAFARRHHGQGPPT